MHNNTKDKALVLALCWIAIELRKIVPMTRATTIICTVTNDLLQDQRMQRICTSLQHAGYEVTLVGRRKSDSRALPKYSFKCHRIKCWFSKGKLFYLEYNLRLLFYLMRQSPTIINAVDLDTLLPAYVLSRWQKAACVYDAHEYFTETPEVVRRPIVQRVWSALAKWVIPRLTYCYTVGPALAQVFQERYRTPFSVVRNLPQLQNHLSHTDSSSPIILYQGMLNEGRGLQAAVLAMQQLPECKLWLVGSGDVEQELMALVDRHSLHEQVKFWGFVPPSALPAITQQAWLGLNLLESHSLSYYYSLANKTFDYINQALPALHMDFPEYRALAEEYDCLLLLPELSAAALATQVKALLADTSRYQTLQQACIHASKALNWANEEPTLLAIYDAIRVENNT